VHFDAITAITAATRNQNKSFPAFGGEQKQANEGNIQLPVDVRTS